MKFEDPKQGSHLNSNININYLSFTSKFESILNIKIENQGEALK